MIAAPLITSRLSPAVRAGTSAEMEQAEIFDRATRRLRRDRAARNFAHHAFLIDHMAAETADRLSAVQREFRRVLILGAWDGRVARHFSAPDRIIVQADAGHGFAKACGGIQCDEDRLPFADHSFDLVVSIGVLDSVNDVPGALALIRRILKPDGLFMGAFVGAGSLIQLRKAAMAADMTTASGASAHIHPQIDVRAGGDLLSRAGFTLQVADGDQLDIGYRDPFRIITDLRGMAATNMLAGRTALRQGRSWLAAFFAALVDAAGPDGRLRETIELVYLTGWSPSPDQPKPALRGSATMSLAAALKAKD